MTVLHDQVGQAFSRAACRYDENAQLQVRTGQWLVECCDPAEKGLDVGCGTGFVAGLLLSGGKLGRVVGVDIAESMLQLAKTECPVVCADMQALPFADGSFDLLTANLSFQWGQDPGRVLKEAQRVLVDGGQLVFAVPVVGSLCELERAWAQVDDRGVRHINQFQAAEDWVSRLGGDAVWEERVLTRWFDSPRDAMQSLKAVGANKVTKGASKALTGITRYRAMLSAYEEMRQAQGIPLTYRILCVKTRV